MNREFKLQIAKKNIEGLYATKILILKEAYNRNFNWWVDILEEGKVRRERIDMSFKDAMKHFKGDSLFRFLIRENSFNNKDYIEVGFRTMGNEDYFLWIQVDLKHLDYFVDKYKLKEVK